MDIDKKGSGGSMVINIDAYDKASVDALVKKKDADIERLREDLIEAEKYNGYHQQACLEIERLRAALEKIAYGQYYVGERGFNEAVGIARSTLQQNGSE